MSARLRLVHLHLECGRDGRDADLAIKPGKQIAGMSSGGGKGRLDNAGLGHLPLATRENTHHREVNTR